MREPMRIWRFFGFLDIFRRWLDIFGSDPCKNSRTYTESQIFTRQTLRRFLKILVASFSRIRRVKCMKTMHKLTALSAALAATVIPSIAAAAGAAAAVPAPTGAAGVIAAVTGLVAGLAAAIPAVVMAVRSRKAATAATAQATEAQVQAHAATSTATRAEKRSRAALDWADLHANAMRDGVVCVITYSGVTSPCVDALRIRGWQVRVCSVTAEELAAGTLLPGSTIRGDIAVADAVVFEGLTVEGVSTLAKDREMRDSIRSGASIVLATGGENHRYDLRPWGVFAVATNTALTTEAAVVASLARRADIARLQGVRPGRLEDARTALLADR
jgi:hypothetical protein